MRRTTCLAIGIAVGFLAGSRAGRGPYDRVRAAAGSLVGRARRRERASGAIELDADDDAREPGVAPPAGVPSTVAGHSPMTPIGLWE